MKYVWIVGIRNDRYCERDIYLYSTKAKAMKEFREEIRGHKDNPSFEYEKGSSEATWSDGGDFCSVSIWKQEVE